ncbi:MULTISPECIES: DUF4446 family protein [unclassified Blautia]|uniref:DUF4446 family protein n=1 Tax=unclassified Blautia TaxID=2648079 RepID=UPI000B376986|nr:MULTISPECIES: DUF4446 family protein [unclassified Blautia]OUN26696.1 hypothetical protein B5G33_15385 [Blautia sp. An81]OUN91390.1 hypothetical protein B5G00_12540 [Blautia sp. An46]
MSNFLDALQNYSGILLLSLLILVIILLICTFNLSLGLSRLNKKYKIFMKGKDGQSLEKLFKRKFDMIEKLASNSEINREDIQKLEKLYNSSLHKYGIVKYDAFEDMGGKLSFVLALLDKENTGFLLNAIHSRENCFLYIKEIVNGESYIMLSEEEVEALKRAVNFGIEESEFDI